MTPAWIVVREERHVDDRHWVLLNQNDAEVLAAELIALWCEAYGIKTDDSSVDELCPDGWIRSFRVEERFAVYVKAIDIRQGGENRLLHGES